MSTSRTSRLLFCVLLASAGTVAMTPYGMSAEFDTDAILGSPSVMDTNVTTQVKVQGQGEVAPIVVAQAEPIDDGQTTVAPAPKGKAATILDSIVPDVHQPETAKSPVDYAADTADYDQANKVVRLAGHVEIKQEGRTLEADRVIYNLRDDIATAEGNVVIRDINGDVHYAQSVELSDHMRKGLTQKLFTTMADGSRAWAAKGIKESDDRYTLKNASYTACKACEEDPDKRPPWQLHAKQVEVRKDEQRIVYHHAWLDMWGVPVLYTPYFSHPDGTVTQKTGFLTPSFGWNSDLGGFYSQPYYWAISPSSDATLTVMPTTKEGPLLRGQYRKRLADAFIESDASVTHSSRTDSVSNNPVDEKASTRSHFFGQAGWDINENWRAGADIQVASDEQYLRQYGFSDDDVLENRIFAERFEGRNYAVVEGLAFQDIRTGTARSADQPNILPYAEMSMLGDPNALLGGRWKWDSSLLSLARQGSGQDEWRGSSRVSWARQDITPFGLVLNTETGARGDGYATTNRVEALANPAEPDSKTQARFIPNAQVTASYPLRRNFKTLQLRVEPTSTAYLAPKINNGTDVPNEDSQDVQLDASNLFEGNRFPGLDRIEDRSHVAYGLKTGLYNYGGGYLDTFLGQSYNLYEDGNPFPQGSGLETQSSDYVGSINASFDEGKQMVSYRFQLDSDTLTSQRHELFGKTTWGAIEVDGNYMYAKGVPGTTYSDNREQFALGSTIDLSDVWSVRGDGVYDLSETKSERGLRRALATLTYKHECYDVAVSADRNLADSSSGVQDTTIMFRVGLKNLGEYSTKAFKFSQNRQSATDTGN